jgi:hypothetical protein
MLQGDVLMNPNQIYAPDMPMGFDIALAKNDAAKNYFYALPEFEQKRIIAGAQVIQSKEEMQAYANALVSGAAFTSV